MADGPRRSGCRSAWVRVYRRRSRSRFSLLRPLKMRRTTAGKVRVVCLVDVEGEVVGRATGGTVTGVREELGVEPLVLVVGVLVAVEPVVGGAIDGPAG